MENKRTPDFKWQFRRVGGLDQVEFKSGEDVCRLGELDPKLWVALSSPTKGLEFDQRTLTLIDADKDGRIRIPEIAAAAEWICSRLKDPGVLLNPGEAMPLDVVDDSTEAEKRLHAAARAILDNLGKTDTDSITQQNVVQAALHASEQLFNGDGILPPAEGLDEDVRAFIRDAIAVSGGVPDAGGEVGINRDIADAFVKTLADWREWNKSVGMAETPLGEAAAECWDFVAALGSKIDDYFLRCELAAYAPSALNSLNLEDRPLVNDSGLLEQSTLAELPLSKAGPDRPLDLKSGINPAWRCKVERFAQLARPLLSRPDVLAREDWTKIQDALAPFAKAIAGRPAPAVPAGVTVSPTQPVESLGGARIDAILSGDIHQRFDRLAQEDVDGPAASIDISHMERLVLYYLHLHRLLINFVNFDEFYNLDSSASFQSGHLFIDGRSCDLCMPAGDVESHAAIASKSQLYLLYCACTRGRKPGESEPEKKTNIVAAVTAGDSDLLSVNRNGVYVDSAGDDWDATVVKIVSNPIGVWQAVWTPYKRIGTLITDQISKYASEKQAGLMASAGKKFDEVGSSVATGAPPKFDIGRNVGIFAAVGLALGAIGTAVGSIFSALLSMSWWQLPLLLLAIFAIISGPSVIMAWLKLRQRTLGPLLEASGWAINGRANLDYAVAKRLSATAAMPPNARRSDFDNMMRARRVRTTVFWIAVGIGVLAVLGWFGGKRVSDWVEKTRREVAAAQAEAAKAAQTPPATPAPEPAPPAEALAPAAEPATPPTEPPAPPADAPEETTPTGS